MIYTDLEDLKNDILKCKYYRTHAWEGNPSVEVSTLPTVQYASYVIASVCTRCGRERIEYIDRNDRRIGVPYYRSPVDYPRTHRLDATNLRTEIIGRSLLIKRRTVTSRSRATKR
jgi:hypothetical protein